MSCRAMQRDVFLVFDVKQTLMGSLSLIGEG